MAIIYTYPQINSSSDLAASDLMIISDMSANGRPTKSLTLKDLADFVTSTGTGTGTTNKIIKWSDGPGGLLGDSIMTENATQIDLAGTFLSTSSPTVTQAAPVSGIKSVLAATASAPHVALYGDSKHTGATQANSNYGVYAKGEFEGTSGFTNFIIGGNLEARYDGSGTNGANASMYGVYNLARATSVANGTVSYMIGANTQARVESANVTATNLQGQHTSVELTNGTAGDVIVNLLDFDGTGGTVTNDFSYLQIQNDTMPTVNGTARAINSKSVLPSLFQGQVEIPLVPTINAHATSKQYVDQQIASIPAGLVFQGNWNASTNTPTLASGTGTVGNYYVVSVAGNTNLDGITDWEVGDWAVFVEVGGVDKWDKIDQTFVQGAGATGQVSFWNGVNSVTGSNNLFYDSSNIRLGIGTNTPSQKLTVAGNIQLSSGGYVYGNSTSEYLRLNTAAGSTLGYTTGFLTLGPTLTYNTASGEVFRINHSNGNVGIGTSNPSEKLHIAQDGNATIELERTTAVVNPGSSRITVANNGQLGISSDNLITFKTSGASGGTERMRISNAGNGNFTELKSVGDQNLFLNSSGPGGYVSFLAGNSERMRINYNGKVGIGTTSPSRLLQVKDISTVASIAITSANTGTSQLELGGTSDNDIAGISYNSSTQKLFLKTNNTPQLYIDNSGNVGIGTDSPSLKLSLPDSAKIGLGDSVDLQIYHDSFDSYIENFTNHLRIRNQANNGDIIFSSDDGSGGTTTYFFLDGSTTLVQFYKSTKHSNNIKANFGNSSDLEIFHSGTHSFMTNATGDLTFANYADDRSIYFQSDDGSGGSTNYLQIDGANEVNKFYKTAQFLDDVQAMFGNGGDLKIYHNSTTQNGIIENFTNNLVIQNNANDKDVIFKSDDGSGGVTEYFRLDGSSTYNIFSKDLYLIDNVILRVGTGNDLRIFHDGSGSKVENYTGNLTIQQRADDSDIVFQCDDGSGGITDYFRLDGSNAKTSFSKNYQALDGVKAQFGDSNDLQIFHDGSNSFIQDVGTGNLFIEAVSSIQFRKYNTAEFMARFINDSAVELYYDNSKKFETTSTGTKTTGQMDLAALNTPVTNSDDNGNVGEIRFTADYIYVCVADDTWKRVALSTW